MSDNRELMEDLVGIGDNLIEKKQFMTIFDILKDIIQNKTGKCVESLEFDEAIGSHYILQRWLSMYSTLDAYILNETTNKLWQVLS